MDDVRFSFNCPGNGILIEGRYEPEEDWLYLAVKPTRDDSPLFVVAAEQFTGRLSGTYPNWKRAREALAKAGVVL